MKIRNGFVSNSSSSSFVLYGISVPSEKIEEFGGMVPNDEITEFLKSRKNSYMSAKDFEDGDVDTIIEYIDYKYFPADVTIYQHYYEGEYVIGRHPMDINDNETGKQFKESLDVLHKIFKDIPEAVLYEEVTEG